MTMLVIKKNSSAFVAPILLRTIKEKILAMSPSSPLKKNYCWLSSYICFPHLSQEFLFLQMQIKILVIRVFIG